MSNQSISHKPRTSQVKLLVGTRKGGLIFTSDSTRKNWQVSEMNFKSWRVMHKNYDPRRERLHAAVIHDVYGPSTHYSDDWGLTWQQARQVPVFERPSRSGRPLGDPSEAQQPEQALTQPEKVLKVWNVQPGCADEPGVLYAGIEPGDMPGGRHRPWERRCPLSWYDDSFARNGR